MVKQVRVNVTVDRGIVKKAKELGLNLSKTFEICLKQRIDALSMCEGKTMTKEDSTKGNGGPEETWTPDLRRVRATSKPS